MKKETIEILRTKVKEVVLEAYRNYSFAKENGLSYREPNMTVTLVMECLPTINDDFTYKPKKRQSLAVWAALEWHRKQGTLGSSLGLSLNGNEARCYEPIKENAQ